MNRLHMHLFDVNAYFGYILDPLWDNKTPGTLIDTFSQVKNDKYWIKSNLLLQQGFKPGLAERLSAWLASAENAESFQQQLYCCANTSSEQEFTTLRPPPHFPPPPSSGSPRSPTTTPTTFPPATTGPSSPPEPSCPPATPSCLSVLTSRYHNLLVALLGAQNA